MESAQTRRYTKAEVRRNRQKVGGAAGGVVAAGLLLTALTGGRTDATPEPQPSADERTVCEVGTETQKITFEAGDGKNVAILAIKGSGKGEGDPCWSEASAAVDEAMDGGQPQYHQTIEIPVEVHPVETVQDQQLTAKK